MRTVEGFRLRKMGSEYIIVGEGLGQVDFNKLIALNHSAAYLWQRIEGKDPGYVGFAVGGALWN